LEWITVSLQLPIALVTAVLVYNAWLHTLLHSINSDAVLAQVYLGNVRPVVEAYLLESMTRVPEDIELSQSFCLLRTAGILPSPRKQDLPRIALDRKLLQEFNPFLSQSSLEILYDTTIVWMELCVLEDRLARLGKLAASPADNLPDIVKVWRCFASFQ
jgi:hypothetical protein